MRYLLPFALFLPLFNTANCGELLLAPFFCRADQNVEVQRCLAYCGLDTSRYKSHSFRIGGACHATDRGYSDAQIHALGRWKSDAFKVYLRSEVLQAN